MFRLTRKRFAAAIAALSLALLPRPALARPADSLASSYYRIVINVPAKTLEVYADGQLIRHCPCAVGRPWTPSPYGVYRIINKVVNPTWYNPHGAPVPPGPSNPLGPRWLGVSKPGYGIHGTNVETSVGTAASHGCVRLSREDILWLYDAVPIGTRVRYVYDPAVVTADPLTGFALFEIAPDLYEQGALTVDRLRRLAGQWGGNLSEQRCRDLIASTAIGAHAVTDLSPAFVCAGRRYSVTPSLRDRTVLIPVAPVARALADAGAIPAVGSLASAEAVPARELADRIGMPLTVGCFGPQLALLSPVVVQLDGRPLLVPGMLRDGEPYVHLPTLAPIIMAATANDLLVIAPAEDCAERPGPVDRRIHQRALSAGEYVSWRELDPLFGPGLLVRRSGACVNLFLAGPS